MFGRRKTAPAAAPAAAPQPAARAKAKAAPADPGPWRDGLGLLAIRSVQIIAVVLLAVGAVWGLRQLTLVVIPVMLAIVFASAFEPVMKWLRARMPSVLATVIVLLGIVVVIGGVGYGMVQAVVAQWDDLYASAVQGVNQIIEQVPIWVNSLPWDIDDNQLNEWLAQAQTFITSSNFGSAVGSGAVAGVGAVANFVTGLVLMVVVLFFFLKDGPIIWSFLKRPFQGEWRERMDRIGTKSVDTIGAYVRGTAAVAAVDAVGIGIGLFILGIPLAFPLTLLVFLLAFIPIVGATLAGVLAALLALVDGGRMDNGLIAAVIVVAIVVAVNQLEGNFLQPVLMGRALKLHSLVILVALTVGTVLASILGAILAVPFTAVVWGIIQVWDGPNLPARWARKK
ncbi:AI-2E family transporter [Microbacterium sorbitolivorans]|uniref:AI-2E family transporter n=1 Tax=Microbacterium sorbitolivorans TaxID=1867410 RepID=A0A367XYE1_9MICO|nr:AI-2E family transporter [Microbacterium sorbitolivorans]RCK58665.1 AI-2E family transporter [Microbacterium sorbitolivorans]GGF38338.1 AI-2E family transporter [Microbacterium sorbitolivorans]